MSKLSRVHVVASGGCMPQPYVLQKKEGFFGELNWVIILSIRHTTETLAVN
jgi:hypothetical protein